VKTAKLFQNGQSQAVRLPKEFRFSGNEVFIKRVGNAVILFPIANSWDILIDSLDLFDKDFSIDRNQPQLEKRESFD